MSIAENGITSFSEIGQRPEQRRHLTWPSEKYRSCELFRYMCGGLFYLKKKGRNHEKTHSHFIRPCAWGTDIGDFDIAAEIEKLRNAAECCDIDVFVDCDDGDSVKIEWWDTWCHTGHGWTASQWSDWFCPDE